MTINIRSQHNNIAQKQMASIERSLLTHQKDMLPLRNTPENTPDSDEYGQSGSSNDSNKRRRVDPSPLQNQYLFDTDRIVNLLKGDPEESAVALKERQFEQSRKEAEFEMSMQERALELKIKTENLELNKALLETVKMQAELMRQLLDMKNGK